MSIQSLPYTCQNPLCGPRGYHGRECCPEKYLWAYDRLVEEFGASKVRLSWVADYGWSQSIGVEVPDGRRGLDVALQRCGWNEGDQEYCINDHPEDLENLIERVGSAVRGFGQ